MNIYIYMYCSNKENLCMYIYNYIVIGEKMAQTILPKYCIKISFPVKTPLFVLGLRLIENTQDLVLIMISSSKTSKIMYSSQ